MSQSSYLDFDNNISPIEENGKPIKPPFGYYGAKHRIASKMIASLPPHNAWAEVFCGSAAVTLAKQPAPIEIINDIDGEIINLFCQLRDHPDELCRMIALTPYAREEFQNARRPGVIVPPIERARRFLIASMMCVNGSVGSPAKSGFSYSQSYSRERKEARVSRWYNLPDRLALIVERLRSIRIENRNALDLLEMFKYRPASLLYLDPPYFVKRSHQYSYDANDEEFHKTLLEKCVQSNAMIFISGYDNELYNSILCEKNGWESIRIETHTRGTNGKSSPRTEVVWKNPQYIKTEKTGRIPIRLSKEEACQKKLNPTRNAPNKKTS